LVAEQKGRAGDHGTAADSTETENGGKGVAHQAWRGASAQ
jgi:hypothetical protein